jgi:O-methyltransferase
MTLVRREGFVQAAVSLVERSLRPFPRLYRFASRTLYGLDRSFYTLSPGLPKALQAAMAELEADGLMHRTDYYEFGVFRGYALYTAQLAARELGADSMRFYGFDSFKGLPAVPAPDANGSMFFSGQFSCSRVFVEDALRKNGADLSSITLVEGFFEDSLTPELRTQHPFRPVGVAVIDCDLYASTVPVLSWLDDLLQPGSILMMDDWRAFGDRADKGQQRALNEWLERHTDFALEDMFDFETHGRAFRVREAEAAPNDGARNHEWHSQRVAPPSTSRHA